MRPTPSTRAPDGSVVRVGEDEGRVALLVDGVVQSISPADGVLGDGYWAAMVPPFKPGRALLLGLGGGTLAHLLVERWGADLRIVGVDDDVAVLETARAAGWLDLAGLEVVIGDAFAFAELCQERFDYAAIDLYRADRFVGRSLTRSFLRRLRELLDPPGWVAVNLFRDRHTARRIERLGRVFRLRPPLHLEANVVVHARAR